MILEHSYWTTALTVHSVIFVDAASHFIATSFHQQDEFRLAKKASGAQKPGNMMAHWLPAYPIRPKWEKRPFPCTEPTKEIVVPSAAGHAIEVHVRNAHSFGTYG